MSRTTWIILALVVLAFVIALAVIFRPRLFGPTAAPAQLPGVAPATPVAEMFHGCPASGDGGDLELNRMKNRVDSTTWQATTVEALLALRWPKAVENRRMATWPLAARAEVAGHNGLPVQAEGYLLLARQQGPESTNCHSNQDLDFHLWLAAQPTDDRGTKSVVVEVTPRIREQHPSWTLNAINALVRDKTRVRISGWTMLDPEHPEEVGKSRATIWEIHPVMKIEVAQPLGGWQDL